MKRSFFDRSNWMARSARVPLTEAEARERHEKRKPYGVLLDDTEGQIEVAFFLVPHFAKWHSSAQAVEKTWRMHLRRTAIASFFQATYTTHLDGTSKVKQREIYIFNRDGVMRVLEGGAGIRQPKVATRHTDVSRNWEMKPTFGSLGAITRRER
jgi:hypothetical protein